MNRSGLVTSAVALAVATVTACSPGTPEAAPSETTTASTTEAPRITDDSGRPPVTFDPCYDLPDDVMTELGYDAANKELADMPMGSYTFLGCRYAGTTKIPGVLAGYGLNVMAGNVTLDEELEKNYEVAVPTVINGRPALLEVGPNGNDECTYALQTDFGLVLFNRLYHKDHPGPVAREKWCEGLQDFGLFAVSSGIDADWVCSAGSGGCRPTVPGGVDCRDCGTRTRSVRRA